MLGPDESARPQQVRRATLQDTHRLQTVVSGEECQMRIVVTSFYRHRLPCLQGDVRRVAHHHIDCSTQFFEEVVNFKVKFEGPVDLYFDLSQMAGLTLDVAWEEVKFSRAHANDFKRVAVVTDSQWVTWSAWISQTFVNADVEVFDDADEAKGWLDQ